MKQAKKIKGKKETSIRDEIRGLGVIIEHVDDKVSLVAEQYDGIKTDINGIKTDINGIKTDIVGIKQTLDSHTEILNSHTETLDSHTEMIGSIKMDIEIMKADIIFIKGGLKKKVDAEEFSALERRVALLEKRR